MNADRRRCFFDKTTCHYTQNFICVYQRSFAANHISGELATLEEYAMHSTGQADTHRLTRTF